MNTSSPHGWTAHGLLALFLRDADRTAGSTDDTKCSIGWWQRQPGDDYPRLNPRLGFTIGELRAVLACQASEHDETIRRLRDQLSRAREALRAVRNEVRWTTRQAQMLDEALTWREGET